MSVAERRRQGGDVESSLSNLNIGSKQGGSKAPNQSSKASASKAKNEAVADSWEEEEEEDDDGDGDGEEDSADNDEDSEPRTPTAPTSAAAHSRSQSSAFPNAPPPTPSSPSGMFENPYALPASLSSGRSGSPSSSLSSNRRPDKSVATASRMIAGALGVRAPKKGEEMRQFERAAREKEERRREREREERLEGERKKEAVWED